jgi:Ca2+-binding EF-hand superfamily protein
MKKIVLGGAALAALAASAAFAHPHGGEGPRAGQPLTRADLEARIDARFARADADRDGYVTQAELRARAEAARARRGERRGPGRQAAFERLDTDRDGMISRAEFEARPAMRGERGRGERLGVRGQGGARMGGFGFGGRAFAAADANRDGRVSRAEARAGALAFFDRVDTNRDGTISLDERASARERFRPRG